MSLFYLKKFFMIKNFNILPITSQNCFTFSKDTFDLSVLYKELNVFYDTTVLDNDIYYAHLFNKDGLFHNPYPIKGFILNKIDYKSSFFSVEDITFATNMENNQYNNYYNSLYKYNILLLYDSILKTFEGYNNEYNSVFNYKKIEDLNFYLFISKNCINIPEFDLFKNEFLKDS